MDTLVENDVETSCTNRNVIESLKEIVVDIDHIAVAVENLDEAIDWYAKKLGFSVIERRYTKGRHTSMISAVLKSGRVIVVLIQGTSPESQVSRFIENFGAGIQHIAFSVDDIRSALQQLVAVGGAADTPLIEDKGIKQVFLRRDPGSGVRVELIERRGGTFSDRTVEELFMAFENDNLF